MKLQKIAQYIERKIDIRKYEKEQKIINKHFKIHQDTTAYDSFEKMSSARTAIANYAKHNGVSVDVYDARTDLGEFASPVIENYLSDKMKIVVTDLNTKAQAGRYIQVVNDKAPHKPVIEEIKQIMVYDRKDGVERVAKARSFIEENFLRNLYRNIEELTRSVKKQ